MTMTLEQVRDEMRSLAREWRHSNQKEYAQMFTTWCEAIDAHLREREAAKAVVTENVLRIAVQRFQYCRAETYDCRSGLHDEWEAMRAALEAVAPMLASALLPDYLKDPTNVHALMLRGSIAIPTIRSMVHLRGEVPNGEDVQLARIAELQEQLASARVPDEFDERKPKVPGYYLVRRFCLDDGEENRTACVEVRMYDYGTGEELRVNLHETNTEDEPHGWYRVEDLCSDFQWLMLAAAPKRGEG